MSKAMTLAGGSLSLLLFAPMIYAVSTSAAAPPIGPVRSTMGWHLLVPPFVPGDPPGALQLKAPIGRWMELDSTETAAECAEQRDNITRMYRSADINSITTQFNLLLCYYAVCVSSFDPRLKSHHSGEVPGNLFVRLPEISFSSTGYTGPRVQHGSDLAANSVSVTRSSCAVYERLAVPLMLIFLGLMACLGSLAGWWLEPTRAGPDGWASRDVPSRPKLLRPLSLPG